MVQYQKMFFSVVLCLLFMTTVYAQPPSRKEMKKASEAFRVVYRDCANAVQHCVDECSRNIDDSLPPCQENCVKAADACISPASIQADHYKILNSQALDTLEVETDACYQELLSNARKCDSITNEASKIGCVIRITRPLGKCLNAAYKRFRKKEQFPEQ